LSSTTNGPLMPPMVLYRILGWTDIMRGSITSGMVAVVSASSAEGCWSGRVRRPQKARCVEAEVGEEEGRGQGVGCWSLLQVSYGP
jgi:hypothetical protein